MQSLCNACGLRIKKKKACSILDKDAKRAKKTVADNDANTTIYKDDFAESLRKSLVALRSEGVGQKQMSVKSEETRKLTQEEEAALLLMTFSQDSSFT